MAKVFFAPMCAIRYVGAKSREFTHSLARPKPTIKKGDILIVDKTTAFNLTVKGYGEYESVDTIEFVKGDAHTAETIKELEAINANLSQEATVLMIENEKLKAELAIALAPVLDANTTQEGETSTQESETSTQESETSTQEGDESKGE